MPMRTPPLLEAMEDADVLAHYGQTMKYVQAFEHTLKSILLLHRVFEGASAGPMNDATFQQLLDQSHTTTLRPVLRDVLSVWQRIGLTPFPAHAEKVLLSMVGLRNRLAHSYLVENDRALTHADGRTMMITELRWYSEAFMSMDVTMQRWIEQLSQHLGETLDKVEADYGPIIEQAVLDALRTNLAGMGISLPEPPRKQA